MTVPSRSAPNVTAASHSLSYPARANEYGRRLSAVEYRALVEQRVAFTGLLGSLFQAVDIVLMPSAGLASPTLEAMRAPGQDART
ncbi:hypothetical protein [Mycobacterium gastri]|uniref:Amidase domain-containing protein n=1 Tax=Mycobacterium gastri TaxID=1777 RepID=A0A1X1W195_MYCGS|nr:hypothetical protein [Mycobacterium gastri]ETW24821.1 hypothetical protein MGAST_06145 [Mycobacterium gastri 'Wayne']ORV79513.1 hypothetical protein AWC07_22450 [Mycobacterium gastri]